MACPICQRPGHANFRPFCSKRCADVDLAKWLTGSYVLPAGPAEEDETLPGDPPDDGAKLH